LTTANLSGFAKRKMETKEKKITVKAFGMIAEKIGSGEIILSGISSIEELKKSLFDKFPELKNMKFSIAINKQLAFGNAQISAGSEIALLPPFSGG
jgi:molybdopterin converting factor small subunit